MYTCALYLRMKILYKSSHVCHTCNSDPIEFTYTNWQDAFVLCFFVFINYSCSFMYIEGQDCVHKASIQGQLVFTIFKGSSSSAWVKACMRECLLYVVLMRTYLGVYHLNSQEWSFIMWTAKRLPVHLPRSGRLIPGRIWHLVVTSTKHYNLCTIRYSVTIGILYTLKL